MVETLLFQTPSLPYLEVCVYMLRCCAVHNFVLILSSRYHRAGPKPIPCFEYFFDISGPGKIKSRGTFVGFKAIANLDENLSIVISLIDVLLELIKAVYERITENATHSQFFRTR